MGFSSTVGDQFVIMVASGTLSGNFSGLQEGQVFAVGQARFQIHYTANSVILIHVSDSATNLQVAASTISQAGEAFDVTVIAADGGGHPDPLYSGTVHFSSQDPYGARLPVDYTFTSADHGQHTFSGGATLFTAGTWDVTSTDSAAGIGGSTNVRVIPGPAFSLAVTAPSSTPSGSAFDITITAQDLYGNTNTNYQGTVTFSTSDTDPGVVLPADYAFQASDQGSVTFGGGVTLITPGDQQIGVRDPMSGIIGSATVTVTNGGSPRGGGRGRIFLPWMGAASERAPTILSPSAICITAPENPWVANAELVGPEPFKGNVASLAFVRGAWTEGAADRAIDLFFSEDPS